MNSRPTFGHSQFDHPLPESPDLGFSLEIYEGLTTRQACVAQMVADGKGHAEIARTLNSDVKVIRKEITHLLKQLNVNSKAQLTEVMSMVNL